MTVKTSKYILLHSRDEKAKIKAALYLAQKSLPIHPVESEKYLVGINKIIEKQGTKDQVVEYNILYARTKTETGDYSEALLYLQKAGDGIEEAEGRLKVAYYQLHSAVNNSIGNFPAGLEYGKKFLQIVTEIGTQEQLAEAQLLLSNSLANIGEIQSARTFAEKSYAEFSESKNSAKMADALSLIALCEFRIGNHKAVIETISRAILLLRKKGKRFSNRVASLLSNRGIVEYTIGQFEDALQSTQSAAEIFKKNNNSDRYATTICHIGIVHSKLEEYSHGLPYLLESHDLAIDLHLINLLIVAKINIGVTYLRLGVFEKAKQYLYEAKKLAEKNNSVQNIGFALIHLGEYSEFRNDHEKALSAYYEALRFAEKNNDALFMGLSRTALARCMEKNNKWSEALAQYTLAYEVLPPMNIIDNVHALLGISRCSLRLGNKDYALVSVLNANESIENINVSAGMRLFVLETLFDVYEAVGDIANAAKISRSIINVSKHSNRLFSVADILSSTAHHDAKKTDSALLQMEGEIKRLQEENIVLKNNLRGQTLKMVQNQEMVSSLQEIIAAPKKSSEKKINELRSVLSTMDSSEVVWNALDKEIERSDPGFSTEIAKRFPSLSNAEHKVCVLLSMRISSKSIASLLFVEKVTIDKHRQNIRKKMGLKPKEDIVAYLEKLRLSIRNV